MKNTNNDMSKLFSKLMMKEYEVGENQARFLFDRWNIERHQSIDTIENFVKSEKVRKVFFIQDDINISKNYSLDDLKKIGVNLIEINAKEHTFKDDKYGYLWKEIFHGMSDAWIGLFQIVDPKPKDNHLCN